MAKLFPILLIILGVTGGGGAGFMLRPAPEATEETLTADDAGAVKEEGENAAPKAKAKKDAGKGEEAEEPAFVKLSNQFVVPVVTDTDVSALVVLSLTLETDASATDQLYNLEPKIRDSALRVLFNHAYAGGFDGHFTSPKKMDMLRDALVVAVNGIAGGTVRDVLITDIIRQDT